MDSLQFDESFPDLFEIRTVHPDGTESYSRFSSRSECFFSLPNGDKLFIKPLITLCFRNYYDLIDDLVR